MAVILDFAKSAQQLVEANFRDVLKGIDELEAEIGETEDRLGIPRSSASDPWEDRLRRISVEFAKLTDC